MKPGRRARPASPDRIDLIGPVGLRPLDPCRRRKSGRKSSPKALYPVGLRPFIELDGHSRIFSQNVQNQKFSTTGRPEVLPSSNGHSGLFPFLKQRTSNGHPYILRTSSDIRRGDIVHPLSISGCTHPCTLDVLCTTSAVAKEPARRRSYPAARGDPRARVPCGIGCASCARWP